MHGKHQHLEAWKQCLRPLQHLESVEPRHGEVEHQNVDRLLTQRAQSRVSVRDFLHQHEAGLAFEDLAYAGPHQRMVVCEQDSKRAHPAAPPGMVASSLKPAPGALPISRTPPTAVTRSRMPRRPRWGIGSPSTPRPSSSTARCTWPFSEDNRTRTRPAAAWRATLVSASCTTR